MDIFPVASSISRAFAFQAGENIASYKALKVISPNRVDLDHVVGVIPRLGLAKTWDSHVTLAVDVGIPAL